MERSVSLPLSFPLLGSRKKVAGRIFHRSAYVVWLYGRFHSLLNEPCVAVHQVDDVGMVLGVLVL